MQLSKLYCNQDTFKNIKFNINGLNVIYAEVKSNTSEKRNSHDLGKTKFAELIDFMLLKQIDSKHFLQKVQKENQSIFSDHIFYLEIKLNSGKFLTVKRAVKENTKISFSLSEHSIKEFTPPTIWVEENLALKKSRALLEEYLSFDFFKNKPYPYRKSISYSLRRQDDFKDVYRLHKFAKGRDIDWKPFMFDLLGFDGDLLREKYSFDNKIDDIKSFIKKLKFEYSVNTEDRDTIVAEKAIVETDFAEIENQIDHFNFYEKDKQLIEEGVEIIENKISDLNRILYQLNFDIDKLKSSMKNKFSFDLEKVKKVFKETSTFFPQELATNYQGLLDFNKKLTAERNKQLKGTLEIKEKEAGEVQEALEGLNIEREKLLSNLTDTNTFSKFKVHQKSLVKVEGKLQQFQAKLDAIDKLIEQEETVEGYEGDIKSTVEKVKQLYKKTDSVLKYKSIRTSFNKFYKSIMDENAILSWKINGEGNVDFIPPKVTSKFAMNIETAKDEGNTYMKLLCVAFDLAILTTYNTESYYQFVYHDDVLSQQDNGIKKRLLALITKVLKDNQCQYILSVIKSDLPTDDQNQPSYFSDEEIVLKLDDSGPNGTLFGFEF